jgi:hypothetical protein
LVASWLFADGKLVTVAQQHHAASVGDSEDIDFGARVGARPDVNFPHG